MGLFSLGLDLLEGRLVNGAKDVEIEKPLEVDNAKTNYTPLIALVAVIVVIFYIQKMKK